MTAPTPRPCMCATECYPDGPCLTERGRPCITCAGGAGDAPAVVIEPPPAHPGLVVFPGPQYIGHAPDTNLASPVGQIVDRCWATGARAWPGRTVNPDVGVAVVDLPHRGALVVTRNPIGGTIIVTVVADDHELGRMSVRRRDGDGEWDALDRVLAAFAAHQDRPRAVAMIDNQRRNT